MKGFGYLIDSKTSRICEAYSVRQGITIEEAMKVFFASTTYRILIDKETGLYLEVYEFVYDMFLEEIGEILE